MKMKEVKVRTAAREEMAKEKARVMRKETKRPSPLEQAAIQWEKRREDEKRRIKREKKIQGQRHTPGIPISIQQISPPPKVLNNKTEEIGGWRQYSPWQERSEEREKKALNESSIWVFAKRLIAREWARALGKERQDSQTYALEREATEWRKKKEEERRKSEEERRRLQSQKEMLQNSLKSFEEKLQRSEEKEENASLKLFEDALESVGEIIDLQWVGDGCIVQLEPWEERRLRRKRKDNLPAICELKINEELEIASYQRI